jgi:uncharacterized protein DUF2154
MNNRLFKKRQIMNTPTRLTAFLVITILALIVTACKPKLAIGPEQTFAVDVPSPASSNATNVTLEMAVPQGSLALAGVAEGLIQGAITYNAAEYEPQMTNTDGALLIRQAPPGPKSVVVSVQNNLINQWDLRMGEAPMNFEIHLENGEYTIAFADSLPADFNATVNAGMGNVDLIIDPSLAARVMIGEKTSLLDVKMRGDWTQAGDIYETDAGSTALTITVNMRGGTLTLDNK